MGDAQIVAALTSGDKTRRADALAELTALVNAPAPASAMAVETAKACVAPLLESVLCADSSTVDSAEATRASLVCCQLIMLNPVVCVETLQNSNWLSPCRSQSNSLAVMLAKDATKLTRDDAMLAASDALRVLMPFQKGFTQMTDMAEMDEAAAFATVMETSPYWATRSPVPQTDEWSRCMLILALEICRDHLDGRQELSEIQLAAIWALVANTTTQRQAVGTAAVNQYEAANLAMRTLQRSSADQWVRWDTPMCGQASALLLTFFNVAQYPEIDVKATFIDSGLAQAAISVLEAFEKAGAEQIDQAGAMLVFVAAYMLGKTLQSLEPVACASLSDSLSRHPRALRFCTDYSLSHLRFGGATSGAMSAVLCAFVWGKDEEDSSIDFSKELVDAVVTITRQQLTGALAAWHQTLPQGYLAPVLHLTISDKNKALLVQATDLVPLLVDALFVDSAEKLHPRRDAANKKEVWIQSVQCNAAECFLQLAAYEPGRELLLQADRSTDPTVNGALQVVADRGMTSAAREFAKCTLIALGDDGRRKRSADAPSSEHVMLSCKCLSAHKMCIISYAVDGWPTIDAAGADQWNMQAAIQRINDSLIERGYVTVRSIVSCIQAVRFGHCTVPDALDRLRLHWCMWPTHAYIYAVISGL